MNAVAVKKTIKTSLAEAAYVEMGEGFPALFIHGLGQSSYFWRYQLEGLAKERRCIAFDLMAHGHTEANPGQNMSFQAQAAMLLEALDHLGIETFDLVLNDSGGAVGQIMAVKAPDRVRSMVLTNCDVHNNWPPAALNEIRDAARAGLLADQFGHFIQHPEHFRQKGSIAELIYEDTATASDEALRVNLSPIVSSQERKDAFNRYAGMQDHSQLVVIEHDLRKLHIPCLIVWGTDDVFFPIKWAYWLKNVLSGAQDVIKIQGGKLFFPEERPEDLNRHIRPFWHGLD